MLAYCLWRCFAYFVQRDVRVLLEKKTMFIHYLCRRITCLSIVCEPEVSMLLAKKMFWVLFVKTTFVHCLWRRTCLHIVCEEDDDIDREFSHLSRCLSLLHHLSVCLFVCMFTITLTLWCFLFLLQQILGCFRKVTFEIFQMNARERDRAKRWLSFSESFWRW